MRGLSAASTSLLACGFVCCGPRRSLEGDARGMELSSAEGETAGARKRSSERARHASCIQKTYKLLRERPPGLLDMYPSQQTNQKIARSPARTQKQQLRSDVCVRIWRGVRVRSSFSSCVCFPAAVASAARVRFLRRGDVLPRGDARELDLRGGKDAPRSSSRAQEALGNFHRRTLPGERRVPC